MTPIAESHLPDPHPLSCRHRHRSRAMALDWLLCRSDGSLERGNCDDDDSDGAFVIDGDDYGHSYGYDDEQSYGLSHGCEDSCSYRVDAPKKGGTSEPTRAPPVAAGSRADEATTVPEKTLSPPTVNRSSLLDLRLAEYSRPCSNNGIQRHSLVSRPSRTCSGLRDLLNASGCGPPFLPTDRSSGGVGKAADSSSSSSQNKNKNMVFYNDDDDDDDDGNNLPIYEPKQALRRSIRQYGDLSQAFCDSASSSEMGTKDQYDRKLADDSDPIRRANTPCAKIQSDGSYDHYCGIDGTEDSLQDTEPLPYIPTGVFQWHQPSRQLHCRHKQQRRRLPTSAGDEPARSQYTGTPQSALRRSHPVASEQEQKLSVETSGLHGETPENGTAAEHSMPRLSFLRTAEKERPAIVIHEPPTPPVRVTLDSNLFRHAHDNSRGERSVYASVSAGQTFVARSKPIVIEQDLKMIAAWQEEEATRRANEHACNVATWNMYHRIMNHKRKHRIGPRTTVPSDVFQELDFRSSDMRCPPSLHQLPYDTSDLQLEEIDNGAARDDHYGVDEGIFELEL